MRTRPLCIGLWLNDEERARLLEQCAVTGLNANAYLRKLIMGESLRPPPAGRVHRPPPGAVRPGQQCEPAGPSGQRQR